MVGVREAAGLIADALEEVQLWGVAVEQDRLRAARLKDLLVALGERAHGDVRELGGYAHLLYHGHDRGELALAAVEQDQVRRWGELLVAHLIALEAAPYYLGH